MSTQTKPGRNRVQADAAIARRSSGAAGTHGDRRTKRNRDRASQKRNAIKEGA